MEILAFAQQHWVALAEGTVIAGLLPLLWRAMKLGAVTGFDWLFTKKSFDGEWTGGVLLRYLNDKAISIGFTDDTYHAEREHMKLEDGEMQTVFFLSTFQSTRLFLYRKAPMFLMPPHHNEHNTAKLSYIRFLRGTVNWEELLVAAAKHHDERWSEQNRTRKRFEIVRHSGTSSLTETMGKVSGAPAPEVPSKAAMIPIGFKPEELGLPQSDDPMEHLALSKSMKVVIDEVKFWHEKKTWYRSHRIPWRHGVALYGKPGTGKTSLVRAICEDLDLPVHVFDLTTMDNGDFIDAWTKARQSAPRAVLFEDFDNVFHGRTNVRTDSDLSFDCILNEIDGIEREDGLLLFVTTNLIEHLDPAMGTLGPDGRSTRPGRIDTIVEIPGIDHDGRLKLARRIIGDEEIAVRTALEGTEDSAAQFQYRCQQVAKGLLWGSFAIKTG